MHDVKSLGYILNGAIPSLDPRSNLTYYGRMKSENENGVEDGGFSSTEVAAEPPIYADLCNRIAQMARRVSTLRLEIEPWSHVASGFSLGLWSRLMPGAGAAGG
jgi:hypothetical protein